MAAAHTSKSRPSRMRSDRARSGWPGFRRLRDKSALEISDRLQKGLPFEALAEFERVSGFSRDTVLQSLRIPARTLARRKISGRLSGDESERLWRLHELFRLTAALFDGDAAAARNWLVSPARALSGRSPWLTVQTEIGAREVENLIGRLEHGVFS